MNALVKSFIEGRKIRNPAEPIRVSDLPFTPRLKKVLVLAKKEAESLGHNYIGTEHVFIAIMREGEGLVARFLNSLSLTVADIRELVISILGTGPTDEQRQPSTSVLAPEELECPSGQPKPPPHP